MVEIALVLRLIVDFFLIPLYVTYYWPACT